MIDVNKIFMGRDGDATKSLYAELLKHPAGPIAVNLLRIAKNSKGGKNGRYSGRGRRAAYDSKDWAIGELCRALRDVGESVGITSWGWGYDQKTVHFENVLYVDLPGHGQVSFHTHTRRDGPGYDGSWDGVKDVTARRCVGYAQFLLNGGSHHDEGNRTSGEAASGDARAPAGGEEQKALDL